MPCLKRIVTLALMLLIGSYGATQAQPQMVTEQEAIARETAVQATAARQVAQIEGATETEEATKDFLGLEWGAGIGVMGSFGGDDAVEKASIINGVVRVEEEGDLRPQLFLEMHVFFSKKARDWRWYQRGKAASRMAEASDLDRKSIKDDNGASITPDEPTMPDPPLMGFGPFIALQSSDNEAIDALTLGVMWGFRKDPKDSASLNVGIGLSFDPGVQVLGGGLKDGQGTDETELRFKKEGQFGWVLMTSFTF
jgi:hypothetical protein